MALTSVISVLGCSPAEEYTEKPIYNELVSSRTENPLGEITSSTSLDELMFNFLQVALRDETSEKMSRGSRNRSRGSSRNLELKLTRVVDDELRRGTSRRELFRFWRYEKRYGAERRHHRKFARRHDSLRTRKILSAPEENRNFTDDPQQQQPRKPTAIHCLRAEYIVFTWILCLIALASALKLYYLVKTALATIIVLMYAALILFGCQNLFLNDIDYSNV